MKVINRKHLMSAAITLLVLGTGSMAQAQSAKDTPWSVEFGLGWDNGLTGNINSSGVGTLNNQTVVVLQNTYNDVYGAGLNMRFGGGYMLNEDTEIRATFTFQSLDADEIVRMGDIGVSNLYGQYTDYQTLSLDVGLRKYGTLKPKLRAYGEAQIGVGFVDKIDVALVAPGANLQGKANDFYDQTAAFAAAVNVGLMAQTGKNWSVFGQLGLRWMSGLAQIDDLASTGLGNINDKSSRWTLPFIGGIRLNF